MALTTTRSGQGLLLALDDGEVLAEGPAISLSPIGARHRDLSGPAGSKARYRTQEAQFHLLGAAQELRPLYPFGHPRDDKPIAKDNLANHSPMWTSTF